MHPEIEKLIDLALADGQITEKERNVILKKAAELGVDADEVEMTLDGRLHQMQATQTKPNKEKVGIIKTCPACGGEILPMQDICSCGHAIRYDALQKLLEEIKKDQLNEAFIIRNFQIPESDESIREFFSYSIGKIEDDALKFETRQVWFAKFNEITSIISTTNKTNIDYSLINDYKRRIVKIKHIFELSSQTIDNNISVNDLLKNIEKIRSEQIELDNTKGVEETNEDLYEKRIINAINNLPIPSKKGEILNLLSVSIANGCKKERLGTLTLENLAWNKKAQEIINKSLLLFQGDVEFNAQLKQHENEIKKAYSQHNFISIIFGVLLVIGIVFWVKSCSK